MFLWFIGGSFAMVWLVFHSTRLDYRLLALGAVIPITDLVSGRDLYLHTLAASIAALVIVMAATTSSRVARRRWLCIPIGMFCHLVLDGVWTRDVLFWWPAFGVGLPHDPSLVAARGLATDVALEIVGGAIIVWAVRRFELTDPARRDRLLRTGTLDPALARGPEAGM